MSTDRLTPILDAIRLQVANLSPTIEGEAVGVYKRRAAVRRQKLDPVSMVTVAKSATPERTTRRRFGLWQTAFVVDVVVHGPYGGPDADVGEHALLRCRIIDLLKQVPLAGAPAVFDLDATAADWLNASRGEATDYDWWAVEVTASVAHE